MSNAFSVPDGNEVLKSDLASIVNLMERNARWVHPDTFRALPVWAPHTARGQPLYDATWTKRYTNTRKVSNVTTDKSEGNVAALQAFIKALDVASPKPKHWTVCHIWGYDDASFSQPGGVVQDRRFFSCVANMVWLPTALKGFTDTIPEIKTILRVCAYWLYGWLCEFEADEIQKQTDQIKSGWTPPDYPQSWPSSAKPDLFPPGVAPFTDRIDREIRKRKLKIKSDLANASFAFYPKEDVQKVLDFWRISLD